MSDTVTVEIAARPGARYLSIPRLCDKLSRKKSWVYDKIKTDRTFPRALRLGAWQVFVEAEVDEWIARQQPQ